MNQAIQAYRGVKPKDLSPQDQKALATTHMKALETMAPKFKAVLPAHVPVERFVRTTISVITQDPALLLCEPKSLYMAALTAAELGLEPNKALGQCYFVQFWDSKAGISKAQLIPGYQGYLTLARNSGEISSISVSAVYKNDKFRINKMRPDDSFHEPCMDKDPGPFMGAYCYVVFKDGAHFLEHMTKAEIDKVMMASKTVKRNPDGSVSASGPWRDWYEEMAKKTVVRRARKYLPQAVMKAAQLENAFLAGKEVGRDEQGEIIIEEDAFVPQGPATSEKSSRLDEIAKQGEVVDVGETPAAPPPPEAQPVEAPAQQPVTQEG